MKENVLKEKAITLIALVIMIILLIVLASITTNMLVGENGIITQAQRAKSQTAQEQKEELKKLASLEQQIDEAIGNTFMKEKGVNKPRLTTGMKAIKFTNPTESAKGEVQESSENDIEWYDYNNKKWANSQTEDGSMWVWIPRYAYKVDKINQKFDIVFLIGTTDNYYDENENLQTAKRCNRIDENVDTTTGYTVHPAFTDETAISYRNGGWDKELTGIWVAKFEAGYASGNNSAPVKASSVAYTQSTSWVSAVERGQNVSGNETARNWLDGIYGSKETAIAYPTFQGTTYGMNYINVEDAYQIAKAMTENENIYGFTQELDSHLMKNSEWGAMLYLTHSQYGIGQEKVALNNINLNSGGVKRTNTAGRSGVDSLYAVTGCTTGIVTGVNKNTTIDKINQTKGNTALDGVYTWNQKTGTLASTTGTIYGIYDTNGTLYEQMASYIANGQENLKVYGKSITYEKNELKQKSTKYTMVYPYDATTDKNNIECNITNRELASTNNWMKNQYIYGDGVKEISTQGIGTTAWYTSMSIYPALDLPFYIRGGNLYGTQSGDSAFNYHYGSARFGHGFRVTLII